MPEPPVLDYATPPYIERQPWWFVVSGVLVFIACVVAAAGALALHDKVAGMLLLLFPIGLAMLEWGIVVRKETTNCGPINVVAAIATLFGTVRVASFFNSSFKHNLIDANQALVAFATLVVPAFVFATHLRWARRKPVAEDVG